MSLFKKSLAALAAIGALAGNGTANAALTNWYLDTDGVGGAAAYLVKDYIDLVGTSFVDNTFTGATTFTFNESGFFTSHTADGGGLTGATFATDLSSTFTGSGTGTTGGALTFTDGTLSIFSGATNIGIFELQEGSAELLANSTLPNGTISIIFKATSLASGYFFDSLMNDLSGTSVVFGFATTNAINAADQTIPAPLINLYNDEFADTNCTTSNSSTCLLLSNNGQYRLAVPEPGVLALAGIGLVGLAGLRRRREVK